MYKLIDKQNVGTLESRVFATKEDMRLALISYHSIDWEGESDINKMSLNDMLEYGEFDFRKLTKEELVQEVHNTLSEISNEDETVRTLEEAMEYFCSTWDKCEGYKHAIQLTLDDQNDNHFDELEEDDLKQLLTILTK